MLRGVEVVFQLRDASIRRQALPGEVISRAYHSGNPALRHAGTNLLSSHSLYAVGPDCPAAVTRGWSELPIVVVPCSKL
jgi:hypothetical protein